MRVRVTTTGTMSISNHSTGGPKMSTAYDNDFTALTYEEFQQTALPLVDKYKAAMGRRDVEGRTKASDIEDARNELLAHCRAWAVTKGRKELIQDFIVAACYN